MIPPKARSARPDPNSGDAEIAALIDTLRATSRRLEALTGSEVDSMVDREGRTFLLQSAQEHLRLHEAAKQAGILNALPTHIALLDAAGFIVSVNDAWRRFSTANSARAAGHGVGVNYLDVCDAARGDGSSEAHLAAIGIRAVLEGRADSFSFEYPCHSPTRQRWFLMTVTPLAAKPPRGAVVMHVNITESKRSEEQSLRFMAAMDSVADAIYLIDRADMAVVHANDAACRMQGLTRVELLARGPAGLLSIPRTELEFTYDTIIASGRDAAPLEIPRTRPDGSPSWVEVRRNAHRTAERWMIITQVRDITERKETDRKVRRLSRVRAVLSGINALFGRATDRNQLLREASQVAVDDGGFIMAWIAMLDPASGALEPVASAGAIGDFLLSPPLAHPHNQAGGLGLLGRALREMKPTISNDVGLDPGILRKAELADRGIKAVAHIPLTVAGVAIGVLALYSADAGFFDDEEVGLLQELAGEISNAIDHLDKRQRLDYLSYYDALTGLPNRSLFLGRVARGMLKAASGGRKLALALIDLKRFKDINDALGRSAGDALLKLVAQWLTLRAGDSELVAHLGANHFAVLLPIVTSERAVVRVLEKASTAFRDHSFALNDGMYRIAARVGVAIYPQDGAHADTLLKNAEAALKSAKASGDRLLLYKPTMTETTAGKLTLENKLRQALDKGEFVLHYQPKVNLATGKLTGAEALIRWNDPGTGLVPPGRFIPVLEETGLIHDVGRWALHQAIADYLRWCAAGLPAVRIAVNVSPLQLRSRGFAAEIRKAVGVDKRAPAGLELEITESLIMEDVKHSIASLQAVRAMGVTVAIDDFGTGFSSLSYLAKLPVDTVKVDRSFVADMAVGPEGLALVSTIIGLAHSLRLNVVAEGVETEEQSRLLRLLDCDEMQGFLFSKAVPGDIFETQFLTGAFAQPR